MDKIAAPINAQDKGPAVANLQQALLFISEKRQQTLAGLSFEQWKQALSDELAQQLFGQRTLQLLLALLPALRVPSAEFVTPPVADALNKVLQDLGFFASVLPVGATRDDAQASKRWSPPRRASGAGLYRPPSGPAA